MFWLERLQGLRERLHIYPLWVILVELLFIWVVVYAIVRFVQGTRAAGAIKGVLVVIVSLTIVARLLGQDNAFQRLTFLYDRLLAFVAIGLIVIFQPELRRAVVRLGETSFFRSTPKDIVYIVDEICEAASYLSRSKFGAIMVIERQIGLSGLVEGGTTLNAELNSRLLQTIFFPGSALHDLAVVIKGRVIHSAGVQLPLAEPADMPDPSLGSRHRAAVGVSKECDAIVVVVSEETGRVRIAERGRLSHGMTAAELRVELAARLTNSAKRTAVADITPEPMTAAERSVAVGGDNPSDSSVAGFEIRDEREQGRGA
ncbi:MAG: diadenylate cyclase CdaA [Phycisphaerales bacterium]